MAINDKIERFVAFTFAAADIVVETDSLGQITYAAGAVHSRFNHPPEALVGRALRDLVTQADQDAVTSAFSALSRNGRLSPILIRLSDPKRTPLAMAGLSMPAANGPARLCVTFAQLPKPPRGRPSHEAAGFTRMMDARLRTPTPGNLGLVDVAGDNGVSLNSGDALDDVLEIAAPGAIASELSPGRFGVIGAPGTDLDLLSVVRMLEETLQANGEHAVVTATSVPLATEGLNPSQVARALRQALGAFTRDGLNGLTAAGMAGGLVEYIRGATIQADALGRAIRERRFELLYQPIVSLADRSVHHYEALIRPEPVEHCPFSSPQEFITLVEALGLTEELDLAVADIACTAANASRFSIAFNVSSQSVQSARFCERLIRLLTASPACRAGLMLVEMTETGEVDNLEEAIRTGDALRALGVPFCLDDFGAGAADIRLLRSLGADIVKLDGSYVAGVSEDGRERAFVAGMVEIARAAGVRIVAERVETESEAAALMQLGVEFGQGWLFGRPAKLPARRAGGFMQRLAQRAGLRPVQAIVALKGVTDQAS
jgi:EAL domain-containing protein (putative c-di-GMP-specific phosphodiesterase class I)